jgi:hypothetical protein
MKKLIVACFILASSTISYSQDTTKTQTPAGEAPSKYQEDPGMRFGFKLSPTMAWLKSSTKGIESDGSKFGFVYGLIADFSFANRYSFSTGIDISYRGGKLKTVDELKTTLNEDSIISTSSNYTMQYIELPLTLKLKTNEIGSVVYYFQIGLSPGVNLSAKKSYESTTQTYVGGTPSTTPTSDDDIDAQDEVTSFNLSMVIGAGLEYTLSGTTALVGGIQFNNGFLDSFENDPKIMTNYLGLTLGVIF